MKKAYKFMLILSMVLCIVCAGCSNDNKMWLVNSGEPTSETKANEGAMYLDTLTNELYQMVDQEWVKIGNVADGKNGVDGKDGIDGKNGVDGKDGTDGKNGVDGKDGIDGKNGADGKDGIDGKNGVDGKDGTDGKNGVDGKDGADGKNGIDGKDGADGRDGVDGITPTVSINENGYWVINGYTTDIKAGNRIICEAVTEKTKTSGNIPMGNYEPGDEYICEVKENVKYNFFVLNTEGTEVNLILDRNINSDGTLQTERILKESSINGIYNVLEWITKEDYIEVGGNGDQYGKYGEYSKGPITIMKFLQEATKTWTNLTKITIENYERSTGSKPSMKTYSLYARIPYASELEDFDVTKNNGYLYGYLDGSGWKHGNDTKPSKNIKAVYGYWTFTDGKNTVDYSGVIRNTVIPDKTSNGVRPVIKVHKVNILN